MTRATLTPQEELTQWYQEARAAWELFPSLRSAAKTLGLSKRQYCDRFVALRPITRLTLGSDTSSQPMVLDANRAYREAQR